MSKALEAAHEAAKRALRVRPMLDAGQDYVDTIHAGKIAEAAISAYLAHLAEDAQGPLSGPEIRMREAIWVELGAAVFDVPVEQLNRAVRASYLAALKSLAGKE